MTLLRKLGIAAILPHMTCLKKARCACLSQCFIWIIIEYTNLCRNTKNSISFITMEKTAHKLLRWSPRLLGILFAIFISLFALDVFSENKEIPKILLALLMHLVPTFILLAALFIAWKWGHIGGIIFIVLGLLYITSFWGKGPALTFIMISGPSFLIGLLFIIDYYIKKG